MNASPLHLQSYQIVFGLAAWKHLEAFLEQKQYTQVAVLVDENTRRDCLPHLREHLSELLFQTIEIPSGEKNKNLDTCQSIWQSLFDMQMDRRGLLVCLGGGVIGDMGGFCASTYKRGIDFVQIPTTLLSQVDSSIGSKLGVDFYGLKNSLGLFRDPQAVLIDPVFLHTLPARQLASGMAEVIKHALIGEVDLWNRLHQLESWSPEAIAPLIRQALRVKQAIVQIDPFEKADRKALNFGHTIGHAVESAALHTAHPLLHGEAIVIGMIGESYLSHQRGALDKEAFEEIVDYLKAQYPKLLSHSTPLSEDTHTLISMMRNDKKNEGAEINCTLLRAIGAYQINYAASEQEVEHALGFLTGQICC